MKSDVKNFCVALLALAQFLGQTLGNNESKAQKYSIHEPLMFMVTEIVGLVIVTFDNSKKFHRKLFHTQRGNILIFFSFFNFAPSNFSLRLSKNFSFPFPFDKMICFDSRHIKEEKFHTITEEKSIIAENLSRK